MHKKCCQNLLKWCIKMTYDCSKGLEICGNSGRFDVSGTAFTVWTSHRVRIRENRRISIHHWQWATAESPPKRLNCEKFAPKFSRRMLELPSWKPKNGGLYWVRQSRENPDYSLWIPGIEPLCEWRNSQSHQLAPKNQHGEIKKFKNETIDKRCVFPFKWCQREWTGKERITSKGVNRSK